MKITIESTTKIVEIAVGGGRLVPARVWEGRTASGIDVHVLVTRIAVRRDADTSQFDRELLECKAPSVAVEQLFPHGIPLRLVT